MTPNESQRGRSAILRRLRSQIAARRLILFTSAGSGVFAKLIGNAGADLLGVYNTGYFRMQGLGSLAGMLPIGDSNEIVLRVGVEQVIPQAGNVPVIAGVNGVDPLRNMPRFLEECKRSGFAGVHNFPTVGWYTGEFRDTLEETGLGFQREIAMLRAARSLGLLTIGYAFNEADALRLMREAKPDVFVFHAGITRGGSTGYSGGRSLQKTAETSEVHFQLAKKIKPDVILLAHGAAIADPRSAQYMMDRTSCHGVQLGSGVERLAIEEPLTRRTKEFKAIAKSEPRSHLAPGHMEKRRHQRA